MTDAEASSIIHFPLIPMAQFNRTLGEIPVEFGGGNRYRVIWAPSRKILRFTAGISETLSAYSPFGGINPIQNRVTPQHKPGRVLDSRNVGEPVPGLFRAGMEHNPVRRSCRM